MSETRRNPVGWFHQIDAQFIARLADVMKAGGRARGVAFGDVDWRTRFRQDPVELFDHVMHHVLEARSATGAQLDRHLEHAACNLMMWWAIARENEAKRREDEI